MKTQPGTLIFCRGIFVALAIFSLTGHLSAQTLYWNQAVTGVSWMTGNWASTASGTPNEDWVNGRSAVFFSDGNATGTFAITLGDYSVVADSIYKRSGAGQLSINGGASRTLTNTSGVIKVDTGVLLLNANIIGTNGLIKQGSGTLNLGNSGNSLVKGYSGATVISEGTLRLLNAVLPTASDLQMDGGILSLSAMPSATTQTVGSLSITDNSEINFGDLAGGATLAVSDGSWSAGVLTVSNWTQGTDFFLTSGSLGSDLLQAIHFNGYDPGAQLVAYDGKYAIIPVPEPSTWLLATAGILWVVCRRRRKQRAA